MPHDSTVESHIAAAGKMKVPAEKKVEPEPSAVEKDSKEKPEPERQPKKK